MKFGDFRYNKVLCLLLSIGIFSIIYFLFNDDNFIGVNLITETIRKELLKTEVKEDINDVKVIESMSNYSYYKEADDEIDKKVENIEKEIEKEYDPKNVNKSFFEQYFNRLYFSVITGCLLGYGDIYPRTLFLKFFVMIQSLSTIIIIIS